MQSRYKPLGWRNESHRHYLAAKGIKTRYDAKKYMALSGNEGRLIPIDPERLEFLRDSGYSNQDIAVFFGVPVEAVIEAKMKYDNAEHHNYMALKDMFKSNGSDNQPMEDERPFYQEHKLKSEGMNLRMHDIGKKHDEIMQKMEEEVKKGNLDPHKREEFFTGDFKKAKEDYLNKTYNATQFHDEVDRSFTYFMKINDKNLRVFGWAKTDAPKKKREYDAEVEESNMVGSGVI